MGVVFQAHRCAVFDLRLEPAELAVRWPTARRAEFLLRHDAIPLSVDRLAWPACLPETSEWVGPLTPFWSSLLELRLFLKETEFSGTVVAVTLPDTTSGPQSAAWRAGICAAEPQSPMVDWKFLGYDVADEGLLSGLMSCGYPSPAAMKAARARWAINLNEHHLFMEQAVAWSFKSEADMRAPEHAPFWVYGLWQI